MLPEAGAFELVFLAMVALIVVGPKDLPVLMRKVAQFTAKLRGLAAEFRSSFDEMARQSELDELRREVEALREGRWDSPHKEAEASFREIGDQLAAPAQSAVYGEAAPHPALSPAASPPPPVVEAPAPAAEPAPAEPRLAPAEAK